MKKLKYRWETLSYLLRHKYYVLVECWKIGMIRTGIIHDWSKFGLRNFISYSRYFDEGPAERYEQEFSYAWLDHIHKNKHHWQYWLFKYDESDLKALPMPEKYIKEMLCDWKGASNAQGNGNTWKDISSWYERKKVFMILHRDTKEFIENFLFEKRK